MKTILKKTFDNAIIDSAKPTLEQISSFLCEWKDSNGFKYSAHNYGEDNKCIKCGRNL